MVCVCVCVCMCGFGAGGMVGTWVEGELEWAGPSWVTGRVVEWVGGRTGSWSGPWSEL